MAKSKSEKKRIEALEQAETPVEETPTETKEVKENTFLYKYVGGVVTNLTRFNLKVKPGQEIELPEEIDNLYFERVN